jgi:hypothetical protein
MNAYSRLTGPIARSKLGPQDCRQGEGPSALRECAPLWPEEQPIQDKQSARRTWLICTVMVIFANCGLYRCERVPREGQCPDTSDISSVLADMVGSRSDM